MNWRCFHCNEVFSKREDARRHFGEAPESDLACRVAQNALGALTALRRLEERVALLIRGDTRAAEEVRSTLLMHAETIKLAYEAGRGRGFAEGHAAATGTEKLPPPPHATQPWTRSPERPE